MSVELKTIKVCIVTILAVSYLSNAAAGTGDWKVYRAYQEASIVAETPNKIFAVYNGSLMSFNPDDNEVKKYSILDGLHDTDIQLMKYCKDANAILIVYTNGNIDIVEGEFSVYNVADILNKNFPDKTIYNLDVVGGMAYISTAFGIVKIDVKKHVVPETFGINALHTKAICFNNEFVYAATPNGVKKASVKANLQDNTNWLPASEIYGFDQVKDAHKILFFKGHFIVLHNWKQVDVHAIDEFSFEKHFYNVSNMFVLNDKLVLIGEDGIYFYENFDSYTFIPLESVDIECNNTKNTFWVALKNGGLTGIKVDFENGNFSTVVSEIKVNSPKRNFNFNMQFSAGKLFVTGGGKKANRYNLPGTLMMLEDGNWSAIDESKVAEETGLPCLDFIDVAVDPNDPNHYFVSSWGEGVYEFKENKFAKLYSHNNSSLQPALPITDPNNFNRYVRVDGLAFDKNNKLYMSNSQSTNGLSTFDGNEWKSYFFDAISGSSTETNRVFIDSKNRKWLNVWRLSKAGVMVIDENDELIGASRAFTDQLNTSVPVINYLCITEDKNNDIWIGTDNGPIIIPDAEYVKDNKCYRQTVKDQYGNGKYMLEKERINCITVDGGNRKWLGSESSGLFVVDEGEGNLTVENFNMENSYLLSNKIVSLAINPKSGELFVGTDKGLCSYMTGAPEGLAEFGDVYAFPNPVRPAHNTWVTITGLSDDSNVKITDMAGYLVKEGKSLGSQFTWNLLNFRGDAVKAGIYLVFATSSNGNQGIVTKIMVLK
ncbi:MAG: T9SS type A sorting domain-containing protein [Dysgonamonadaceae bacterium]|jgi:hypothetical protein|nr:T9SS type A sorting domain-containing protein [Dysgonamonadaceae bacterium]